MAEPPWKKISKIQIHIRCGGESLWKCYYVCFYGIREMASRVISRAWGWVWRKWKLNVDEKVRNDGLGEWERKINGEAYIVCLLRSIKGPFEFGVLVKWDKIGCFYLYLQSCSSVHIETWNRRFWPVWNFSMMGFTVKGNKENKVGRYSRDQLWHS